MSRIYRYMLTIGSSLLWVFVVIVGLAIVTFVNSWFDNFRDHYGEDVAVLEGDVMFIASGREGEQVVEHGLGEVPGLIVFRWGDHDAMYLAKPMGATDGLRQWAVHAKVFNDDSCIVFTSLSGGVLAKASFVSWNDTSFTIKWSGVAPPRARILALVMGGSNWVAEVGTFMSNALSRQAVLTVDNTGVWEGGLFYRN